MPDLLVLVDVETTGITYDDVPIEIGAVVTDPRDWREIAAFTAIIGSPEALDMDTAHYEDAERFHGISRHLLTGADPAAKVAGAFAAFARLHKPTDGRLILTSDNVQFEWRHADWLLAHIGLTCYDLFHYCGWDTSILSLFTDFKDPKGTAHRALPDVRGVLAELRRVATREAAEAAVLVALGGAGESPTDPATP